MPITRKSSRLREFAYYVLPWMVFALAAHALSPMRGGSGSPMPIAAAETPEAAGMVDVRARIADLDVDMRYAGPNNFTGGRVDGYEAGRCFLQAPAADALARAEATLRAEGLRLRVYDCYRPARAVQHFVRWAADLGDQRTKATHYPNLSKRELLGDYISPTSGHSRGATLDLTLLRCEAARCLPLDMGTGYDFFDPRANTDSPAVSPQQRGNRERLRAAMAAAGFRNYPLEWWHYTLDPEPEPKRYFDFPIR
jgi:D-alanyl-D-alanine dipeptidase